jgi:hypothetical protein
LADIFISYAREDAIQARALADLFVGKGWTVFFDIKIRGGKDFSEIIRHEIALARCVVVLWSSFSVNSRWVKAEAREADEQNKLIPALLENVIPPLPFSVIQTESLVGWKPGIEEPGLVRLIDSVADLLKEARTISSSRPEDRQLDSEHPESTSLHVVGERIQKIFPRLAHVGVAYALLALFIIIVILLVLFKEKLFLPEPSADHPSTQSPVLTTPQSVPPIESEESATLQILLSGLIALVPANGLEGANHMTALLVDARTQPAEDKSGCFAPYRPSLTFLPSSSAECVDAGCNIAGPVCTCELSGHEISIQPDTEPAKQKLKKSPDDILPQSPENVGDFSFIANLARAPLSQTLDSRTLERVPPSSVVARMTFPFEAVTACALVKQQNVEGNYIVPMSFRRLGMRPRAGELQQAVAQAAAVKVPITSGTVTLTISDFEGTRSHRLALKSGSRGYRIQLANDRNLLVRDSPCADGIARDFAFFYDLAVNPPPWMDRYVPIIRPTQLALGAEAPECGNHVYVDVGGQLISPMATFNP